jgi:peptidoglycan/xylan/chitin deacetylase (PgdA/CDA1 family)
MFRMDRFISLYIFDFLIRRKIVNRGEGIPILMYHSISEDFNPGLHPYYQTNTSPNTFSMHMKFLYENGYSVLPLQEAVDRLRIGVGCGQKSVVLTFDDGFRDFYKVAFPILRDYGFTCTVFLPTAYIDNTTSTFKGKECLSWDEIKELHSYGIAFGSHTMTHPRLTALNIVDIKAELEQSKKLIEMKLNENIQSFSYPFAFPEEDVNFIRIFMELLQSSGYHFGVTTKIGISERGEDPLFLKRIPLNERDDLEFLKAKLDGAYDWVYGIQKVFKSLKRMLKH